VQSYLHIVDTQGKRGAASKTSEIYGISHMTVRRYVAAHEAAQNVPEVPLDLAYCPPPGGYDPPIVPQIDIEILTEPSQTPLPACEELMSSEKCTNETGTQESTNVTAEPSQPEPSQIHSAELETPMVAAPETAQPLIVPERVVTRIVRLPAEPTRRGIYDRLADVQIESFMGPELGLIVAAILIAITWGFG
jgi:hypothetical protein